MSKRSPRSDQGEPDALPPIPDGGLGSGMPEWLRRPPAWRSAGTSAAPPAAPAKALPHPDTSPIDPRSILTVEDLPAWLQGIAHAASIGGEADLEDPAVEQDSGASTLLPEPAPVLPGSARETSVAPSPERPAPTAVREPAPFLHQAGPGTVIASLPERRTPTTVSVTRTKEAAPPWFRVSSRPSPLNQKWNADTPTLALSAALLVALVVIVLLATGVL